MKRRMEKISVIIPVYNQKPEYFKEAIESVINQTIKPYEIIIVDDGSNNPPLEFALPDGGDIIKIVRNEKNMGIGFFRQRGADEATGDYITFLSSDDVWEPNFLEIMIKTAKQYPGKILFSNYDFIENNKVVGYFQAPNYDNHEDFCIACFNFAYRNTMFVNFSTTFFPKEIFNKIKFDKNLRFGEDLDFLLKSMKHFKYHLIPLVLLHYRTGDNLTSRIRHKIGENNEGIIQNVRKYWEDNNC